MRLDYENVWLRRPFLGVLLLVIVSAPPRGGTAQDKAPPPVPKAAAQGKGKIAIESDMPLAVAFAPRGTTVAAAGFSGAVRLWNARTGALLHMIPGPNRATRRALAFSPDGKMLAVGGDDGAVRLWEVATGESKGIFADHLGDVLAVAFSPNGQTLATAAGKYEIKQNIATGRTEGEIRLWDVRGGKATQSWKLASSYASSLAFSPDGTALASAEGPVLVRSVQTGQVTHTFSPERGTIHAVAFSPDGKELAGGGGYPVPQPGGGIIVESEVRIWGMATGKLRLTLTDLHPWLRCLAFSPDTRILATGGGGPVREDRSGQWVSSEVRLWDVQTGKLLRAIEGKLGETHSLAFSPHGQMVLIADDAEVVLLETSTGLRRTTLMTVTERLVGQ
jgi:tricorn protease-like protein